jgi:hypothetical protein
VASGFSPVFVLISSGKALYLAQVTVTINADDPRTIKALELAAEADHWLKGHNADGDEVFGVPSQSEPGRYYIVTRTTCDCPDFRRDGLAEIRPAQSQEQTEHRACKHILAVRLHCELVRAQHRPPSSRRHLRVLPDR